MAFDKSVHAKAAELVKLSVEMTTAAGSGHPTSAASLAHVVTVLLYHHMRFDPAEPDHTAADRLVLSEGHACPIVYAAAADIGMMAQWGSSERRPLRKDDVLSLRELDSPLDGHPNPAEGFSFFPAATGSLGQGLSIAAGIALSARLDENSKRIFCILGDGESREGQVAEALDFLIDYKLKAVCPIFNCNGQGQADRVSLQQGVDRLEAKLRAIGFDPSIIDGHDPTAIRESFDAHTVSIAEPDATPIAIVARTVKGWGFNEVIGSGVHGKAADVDQCERATAAVESKALSLGARYTEGDLTRSAMAPAPPRSRDASAAVPKTLGHALRAIDQPNVLTRGKLSPRKAHGIALRMLGHADSRIVVLDGDVCNSTYSEYFRDDSNLRHRFFECKIAEQNMVSCAGGLACDGKIPFVSTFGKFLVRAYDQIEMGLISRFPLKLVGSHVGASVAADGPSQMALTDVAFFRALAEARISDGEPLVHILNPADAFAAYALTLAMAEHPGACYLRTMRPEVPFLYGDATDFHLGGHQVLAEGSDLLIAATGYMVHEARQAALLLRECGVRVTLVDLYSLPLDRDAIVALANENRGRVLTVEDHYWAAFGSAVTEALAAVDGNFRVERMYVRRIPKSARTAKELLQYLGLSADDIVGAAAYMLGITTPSQTIVGESAPGS